MNFSARRVIGFTVFSAVITMTIGTASHDEVWKKTHDSVLTLKSTHLAKGDDMSYVHGESFYHEHIRRDDFESECMDMAVMEHINHPGSLMAKEKRDAEKRKRKVQYFMKELQDLTNVDYEDEVEEFGWTAEEIKQAKADDLKQQEAFKEELKKARQDIKNNRSVTRTLEQYMEGCFDCDSFDDNFCNLESENKLKMLHIIIQLLEATIVLHQRGIAHTRIGSKHIVYNKQSGQMMLMDFGKSVLLHTLSFDDLKEKLHEDIEDIVNLKDKLTNCEHETLYEDLNTLSKMCIGNKNASLNGYFKKAKSVLHKMKTAFERVVVSDKDGKCSWKNKKGVHTVAVGDMVEVQRENGQVSHATFKGSHKRPGYVTVKYPSGKTARKRTTKILALWKKNDDMPGKTRVLLQ